MSAVFSRPANRTQDTGRSTQEKIGRKTGKEFVIARTLDPADGGIAGDVAISYFEIASHEDRLAMTKY